MRMGRGSDRKMRRLLLFAGLLTVLLGCGGSSGSRQASDPALSASRSRYEEIAGTFLSDPPGYGIDILSTGPIVSDENAGMIAFAEAHRYRMNLSADAQVRLRKSVQSLLDRKDLDGLPGVAWGLGVAWDAFGDGTVNSENHPYTVTNAIVIEGLLEAIQSGGLENETQVQVRAAIRDCVRYTMESMYLPSGYFGYSPAPTDMVPVLNVTAYTAGVVLRALAELPNEFTALEKADFRSKCLECVASVVNEVVDVEGAPQWNYHSNQSPFWARLKNQPNDLFHHAYIIWGLEMARIHGGASVPFTRAQYLASLRQYFRGTRLYGYPEKWPFPLGSDFGKPSRVWGPGYCVGIAAFLGDNALADQFLAECVSEHPGWPTPRSFPGWFGTSDPVYYPRYGANILWGLGIRAYGTGF